MSLVEKAYVVSRVDYNMSFTLLVIVVDNECQLFILSRVDGSVGGGRHRDNLLHVRLLRIKLIIIILIHYILHHTYLPCQLTQSAPTLITYLLHPPSLLNLHH